MIVTILKIIMNKKEMGKNKKMKKKSAEKKKIKNLKVTL